MSGAGVRVWLPGEKFAPQALEAFKAAPPGLSLVWLDAVGASLSSMEVAAPARAAPIETSAPGGSMAWSHSALPLRVEGAIPDGAEVLEVKRGEVLVARMAAAAAAATPPRAPDAVLALGAVAGWRLAVVSERFDDPAAFFARCRTLFSFIGAHAPFDDPAVHAAFGLVGLFWRSDPVTGLFGATDDRINGRVLYGDEQAVGDFVHLSHVDAKKVLVLINSTHRAGAGGADRSRPSWSTITSGPGEQWESIAVHELGHAFGLADEYEDNTGAIPENAVLEPNVTREKDPTRCSWSNRVNVPAPPVPTLAQGQARSLPAGAIGTFEGARYQDTGRYRPTLNCRMRQTSAEFCPICQAHIRSQLLAPQNAAASRIQRRPRALSRRKDTP